MRRTTIFLSLSILFIYIYLFITTFKDMATISSWGHCSVTQPWVSHDLRIVISMTIVSVRDSRYKIISIQADLLGSSDITPRVKLCRKFSENLQKLSPTNSERETNKDTHHDQEASWFIPDHSGDAIFNWRGSLSNGHEAQWLLIK